MAVFLDIKNFPIYQNQLTFQRNTELRQVEKVNKETIRKDTDLTGSLMGFLQDNEITDNYQKIEHSMNNLSRNLKFQQSLLLKINKSKLKTANTSERMKNSFKSELKSSIKDIKAPPVVINHPFEIEHKSISPLYTNEEEPGKKTKHDNNLQNNCGLFYVQKNQLRPVLSTNIKPGIYQRFISNSDRVQKSTKQSPNNVFLCEGEKNGKILRIGKFYERYAMNIGNNGINKTYRIEKNEIYGSNALNSPSCNESEIKTDINHLNGILPVQTIGCDKQNPEVQCNRYLHKQIFKIMNPDSYGLECDYDCREDSSNVVDSSETVTTSNKSSLPRNFRNRPKKSLRKKLPDTISLEASPPPVNSTTKYGRISKPPKYSQSIFKLLPDKVISDSAFDINFDSDYKYPKADIIPFPELVKTPESQLKIEKRERNLPPDYRCSYCHKIYLGKKMQRHLEANPNHNVFSHSKQEDIFRKFSLYQFLVNKLKYTLEDQRTELFLNEISDLVEQLQLRGSRFVRNTSGTHFVNVNSAKVLGIPEGHYSIDISAIESVPDIDAERCEAKIDSIITAPPPPRLDYNLSISLDDTISDGKLNLPDNIISSEESLLRTVNDLVDGSIGNLRTHGAPIIHYDQASDNAVEAVTMKTEQTSSILDLPIDLFEFGTH